MIRARAIVMMKATFLGIEIGGTKLQIVQGDGDGTITRRWRHTVDSGQGGEGIRQHIAQTLRSIADLERVAGVGVGFGGPVQWRTGRIACSHQIEGWNDFDLGGWLRNLVPCPARIDNDANVAALGEAIAGAGRGKNPVFYVTLGSGVGGGLVVDGAIFHGAPPGEIEVGHLRLDRNGTTVESRCSGWAVDRRVRKFIAEHPGSGLARQAAGEQAPGARLLGEALRRDDPDAKHLLAEVTEDLAFALAHVTHLCHPEIIILGGGLSLLGPPLRDGVAGVLPCFVMRAFHPGPSLALAGLAEDAVPAGALILAARGEAGPGLA